MAFPFGQLVNLNTETNEDIDILHSIGVTIDRIGIQGRPGMPFILNNENMHIGRTGLFEIETEIKQFSINKSEKFIVDYHIKD